MTTETRLITADELIRMREDECRYELVKGVLHTFPFRSLEHGIIAMNIMVGLGSYVMDHKLGYVYPPGTGFLLGTNPDTVLAPSGGFVRRERVEATGGLLPGYRPGAPDVTVEIISSREVGPTDIKKRVEDWLAGGARLVWIVDTRHKTVAVHQPDHPPVKLTVEDQLDGGDVVPGWTFPVREVFS
jgi:Uma2 family endonuclease